ncbi:MAG: hypothetical protein WD491_02250 [Balneolales bacterium]
MKRLILLSLVLIIGCSQDAEKLSFTELEVDDASLIISAEVMPELGRPFRIKAESDGFLLYDAGAQKLIKFDFDGNKLFSFGGEGRGPGEFQIVSGFWKFDDFYMVYDYNSAKFITYDHYGDLLEEIFIEPKEFPSSFPVQIQAITPHQFAIPTRGENESLLKLIDLKDNYLNYFGNAVGEHVTNRSGEQIRQAIASRRVPDYMLNYVSVSSNQTGIFSFQQATAMLEKYTYSGELVWAKNLKVPAIEDLFESHFNNNIPFFNYSEDIHANEEGVAILLQVIEDEPATIVWVPNDGGNINVVSFPNVKKQQRSFTIAHNESYVYFVNTQDGEISRATWPL